MGKTLLQSCRSQHARLVWTVRNARTRSTCNRYDVAPPVSMSMSMCRRTRETGRQMDHCWFFSTCQVQVNTAELIPAEFTKVCSALAGVARANPNNCSRLRFALLAARTTC